MLADYAKDIREALIALVQGNHFAEAKRIVCTISIVNLEYTAYFLRQTSLHRRPGLVKDVIHPGALESRSQLSDDLSEMREQLRKQLNRIHELRVKKQEEPGALANCVLHIFFLELTVAQTHFMASKIAISPTWML